MYIILYIYHVSSIMMNQFISTGNVQLLWEVMLDNADYKRGKIPNDELKGIFYNNLKEFSSRDPPNISVSLFELNKTFLSELTNKVWTSKKQVPNSMQVPNNNNKELHAPYTAEELQLQRQTLFESELEKRKKEFEDSITLKKPESPVFLENVKDEKIKELDTLIAQTVAQRNYEIQEIQNQYPKDKPQDWLQPQESSLRAEKQKKITYESIVHLEKGIPTIEEESFPSKKISWDETKNETYYINQEDSNTIITRDTKHNTNTFFTPEIEIQQKLNVLEGKVENIYNTLNKILDLLQPTNKEEKIKLVVEERVSIAIEPCIAIEPKHTIYATQPECIEI